MILILVTNDDGVDAPGLLALKQALERVGEVKVVAPDRNWSASGHAKTMHRPLRIRPTTLRDGSEAYSCDGAPSDCVAVALLGFFPKRPTLVVSGINPNLNVGSDLTYSGTVAAAMEGALAGVPAIAVSLDSQRTPINFDTAAKVAAKLAEVVCRRGLPPETLLNVNVPEMNGGAPAGVRVTRCGRRVYYDQLLVRHDPEGNPYYWIGGDKPGGDTQLVGTDIWAIAYGFVSITPIHMDMTSHSMVEELQGWVEKLQLV